jgi:hypothetical protein
MITNFTQTPANEILEQLSQTNAFLRLKVL